MVDLTIYLYTHLLKYPFTCMLIKLNDSVQFDDPVQFDDAIQFDGKTRQGGTLH